MTGTRAEGLARGIGAMIDGVYLREALGDGVPDGRAAAALVEAYLAVLLRE